MQAQNLQSASRAQASEEAAQSAMEDNVEKSSVPSSSGPIRRHWEKKTIIPYSVPGMSSTSGGHRPNTSTGQGQNMLSTAGPTASTVASPSPLPLPLSKSCLECSRLKIRCSRTIPCTSCVRRGVEQICPNGKMEAGKGRRLIMADSKVLHERIGVLERALARSHEEKLRAERELSKGSPSTGTEMGDSTRPGKSAGSISTASKTAKGGKRRRGTETALSGEIDPAISSGALDTTTTSIVPHEITEIHEDESYLRGIDQQHPALRDAYLYSPKDPPTLSKALPTTPMSTGFPLGRSTGRGHTPGTSSTLATPIRDIRDLHAEELTGMSSANAEEEDEEYQEVEHEASGDMEVELNLVGPNARVGSGRGTTRRGRGARVKAETDTVPFGGRGAYRRTSGGRVEDEGRRNPKTRTGQDMEDSLPDPRELISSPTKTQTWTMGKRAMAAAAMATAAAERAEDAEISLGTLTIGPHGEAEYVGAAGGSSFLHESGPSPPLSSPYAYAFRLPYGRYQARPAPNITSPISGPSFGAHRHQHLPSDHTNLLGPDAPLGSVVHPPTDDTYTSLLGDFPLAGSSSSLSLRELWEMIPAWEADPRGESVMEYGNLMVQAYWENCDWMYNTLPRPIFDADYLPAVYDTKDLPSPHKLACVYLVMALGVMFDLERREPFDPLGGELFRLGVACLTVNGALSRPTVATVQALNLMGNFMLNDKSPQGAQAFWPFLGVAANCVTALGLHRDGTNFGGLSPFEIEERRKVFWEITTLDRLQAMCFARPCALANRSIDSKFPGEDVQDEELRLPDPDGYNGAKYELVKLMDLIIEEQTRTTKGTYQNVLAIDEKIVNFRKSLPAAMLPEQKASALSLAPDTHPHVMLHRFSIRLLVCETRIYLHRLYFTKALRESPSDPSKPDSVFAKSFVAVFESAVELISIVRQSVVYHPALTSRWWFFWFHAFSAAVCLAAVCIRAPSSAFSNPAYMSLVMSCDIASAAAEGTKAKGGLPVLLRLRQRAFNAMLSIATVQQPDQAAAGLSHSGLHQARATGGGQGSEETTASVPETAALHMRISRSAATGFLKGSAEDARSSPPDDDLSHLSNRPQLRRVNKSLTSPLASTPALMTDEGIASSTGRTRSAGSVSGSVGAGRTSGSTTAGERVEDGSATAGIINSVSPPLSFRLEQQSHGTFATEDFLRNDLQTRITHGTQEDFVVTSDQGQHSTYWSFPGHDESVEYVRDAEMANIPAAPELSLRDIDAYGMLLSSQGSLAMASNEAGRVAPQVNFVYGDPADGGYASQTDHQVLVLDPGAVSVNSWSVPDRVGISRPGPVQRGDFMQSTYLASHDSRASLPLHHAELVTEFGHGILDTTAGFDRGLLNFVQGFSSEYYPDGTEGPSDDMHATGAVPFRMRSGPPLEMMDAAGTQEDIDRFLANVHEGRV